MIDPICDMLNRIRNAQMAAKEKVEIPYSKIKNKIASILHENGFILGFERKGKKNKKIIDIYLKYENKIPAISGLKRISKPGQRIYKGFKELKPVKSGYGIAIISTSKGLMTDKEAKKQKIGGEVICEIW